MTPKTPAPRKAWRTAAHAAAVAGLYLAFSFSLFLGLQVDPAYGNAGVAATVVLAALYVYVGFVRGRRR